MTNDCRFKFSLTVTQTKTHHNATAWTFQRDRTVPLLAGLLENNFNDDDEDDDD